MLPTLSNEEILRYSRHLLIPDVGIDGQRKLKAASVLIVGTGGLGSPVALYLAAAGVGKIGLIDYDRVEVSNLQRQIIHSTNEISSFKVNSAKKRILEINPFIQVEVFKEKFTSANAPKIAQDYDLIIDGSDNFPTRYLINDYCVLTGKPYIYGSIYRFDGQVSVFDARFGPCYRCLFPEPPPPGLVPTCNEGGVLGVLPGTVGTLQATEALKIILGIGETLTGRLLLYNALDLSFEFVTLRKNPQCKVCGSNPEITSLIDYHEFCGVPNEVREFETAGVKWDITVSELAKRLKDDKPLILLDVRDPHEAKISNFENSTLIPLGELASRLSELDTQDEIVVFCKSGIRSVRAVEILIGSGFQRVKNLQGGINAWAINIDPKIPVY